MFNFNFLKKDIIRHIERNKTVYVMLLLCFLIGIVIGFVVAVSNVSFLGLLNTKNKTFINFINGSISSTVIFWNVFAQFIVPVLIIFVFALNYYLSYLTFIFFIYQSTLLFLTMLSVIETYNFLGFLKIFFITLPVNILFFLILMFWIVSCFKRARKSYQYKYFLAGFDKNFKQKVIVTLIMIFILSLLVGFIIPLLLKTAIFLSF